MAKTTSDIGIHLITIREGAVLHGYLDSKKLLTIGVGHLVVEGEPYTLGGKITQAESDRLLKQDLKKAEDAVNSAVKVPLSQNQFDALVSFTVNIGTGGFKGSTVVKRLNAGDYEGAAKAMMRWVKPPEITGRREAEKHQFETPYPKTSAAASSPDGSGKAADIIPRPAAAARNSEVAAQKPATNAPDETANPPAGESGQPQNEQAVPSLLDQASAKADQLKEMRGKAENVINSAKSVVKMSKPTFWMTVGSITIGIVNAVWSFITDHPYASMAIATAFILVGLYLYSKAKDRQNKTKAAVIVAVATDAVK